MGTDVHNQRTLTNLLLDPNLPLLAHQHKEPLLNQNQEQSNEIRKKFDEI